MAQAEPTGTSYSCAISRYFFATRPPFLLATLGACGLGLVSAYYSGVQLHFYTALVTLLLALLLHAAVNVLNDYFDALNGSDDANQTRIYPFTGGSRFIQNGVLTVSQTKNFGLILLGLVIIGGLLLIVQVGSGIAWLGLLGVVIGWAYSANPVQLNARGWGEWCVLFGFLGFVVGADYVQRQAFAFQPIAVGTSYGLLVTMLLYINQFPDRIADGLAHKRTLVVRLPLPIAVWGYALIALLVAAWLLLMVLTSHLPWPALISLLPLILTVPAFFILKQHAATPQKLTGAIKLTLASMLSHAVLLMIILIWMTP